MKRKLVSALRYLILSLVSLISVFPIYWMAVSATNTSAEVTRGRLLPGGQLAANFKNLLANQNVAGALWNSLRNAVLVTLLALIVCSVAGYGFEIFHTKGKDRLMSLLLLAMMIPFAATMIPLFQMFSKANLLSSLPAVVLPTIATPFLIMMFRQSARSFPHEIIEAARIDGLGEIQIFSRMFIPTMKSTYAAAMTVTFMSAWNNYLWPRVILLDTTKQTMPMLVANLTSGYVTDYGALMLAVLITTIPTVIIFFLLQRHFAEGIVGAVK